MEQDEYRKQVREYNTLRNVARQMEQELAAKEKRTDKWGIPLDQDSCILLQDRLHVTYQQIQTARNRLKEAQKELV